MVSFTGTTEKNISSMVVRSAESTTIINTKFQPFLNLKMKKMMIRSKKVRLKVLNSMKPS
jgi:hypothetical protein